jgi:hypothetical protein
MTKKGDMKYVEKNNVFFVGFKDLHPDDQKRIKEIIYKDYILLERELKKINSLKLTFKTYEKGGRKKYSVKLLVDSQAHPITVDKMYSPTEWDPVACVHKVLAKAREQIIHKFKTDSNYRKPYEKGGL